MEQPGLGSPAPGIAAMKEFSGDVRRSYRTAELVPELNVICSADDVSLAPEQEQAVRQATERAVAEGLT